MTKLEEIWKQSKMYFDYEVSNLGRVRKKPYTIKRRMDSVERYIGYTILRLFENEDGYMVASIRVGRKYKRVPVHRLVADAFIPNEESKPCIDHINTIRTDNRVENLRWVTPKENSNNELTKKHLRKPNARRRKVCQYDTDGNLIAIWESGFQASQVLKLSQANINACCHRKYGVATTGGYVWRFCE